MKDVESTFQGWSGRLCTGAVLTALLAQAGASGCGGRHGAAGDTQDAGAEDTSSASGDGDATAEGFVNEVADAQVHLGLPEAIQGLLGCDADVQCEPSTPYCVDGECAARKPLGSACADGAECAAGASCVSGVCCASAACPICQVCGAAGQCGPAAGGTSCSTPNAAMSACDGKGACGETACEPGYLDCDGNPNNGCETPFSLGNCGGCGKRCEPQNVFGPVCSPTSGGCTYTMCAPFDSDGNLYLDCDGNMANGCEAIPSDEATCGSCKASCGPSYCCELRNGSYSCRND